MKVVFSPEALARLENQIAYLRDRASESAAERLRLRVEAFLRDHLAHFPNTGHAIENSDLREIWIPGTRVVL